MYKTINFIEVQKLESTSVQARIEWKQRTSELEMSWDLSNLGFDPSNYIVLEIWSVRSIRYKRCNLGAFGIGVGNFKAKLEFSEELDAIRCRFKIVKKFASGRPCLVASLDGIKPLIADDNLVETSSLLAIQTDDELKHPWELRFENSEPTLYLHPQLSQPLRNRAQAPWFHPIILSEILGQIFDWLASPSERDENLTTKQWEEFMIDLGCPPDFWLSVAAQGSVEPNADLREIRALVLKRFAAKHDFVRQLTEILHEDEIQI